MNLVDAYVVEIKGTPVLKYGKWFVKVSAKCYGVEIETEIMCKTEDEAKKICTGYHFLT